METYSNQALYAPNERRKINQFKFGVMGDIEPNIAHQRLDTYVELLQQWYVAEKSLRNIWSKREQENKL